jgi:hypothetical protein
MVEIYRNQVIQIQPDRLPLSGLARVIWFDHHGDNAMLIAVEQKKRSPPVRMPLGSLQSALAEGHASPATLKPDPRSLMSDTQLTASYPPRNSAEVSFPISYRNYWWSVIAPIISNSDSYFQGLVSLAQLINTRAQETQASRQRIYQILYQFWANGSSVAALLPGSVRCGGRGKTRASGKASLGRITLKAAMDGLPANNYPLSRDDIEHLQFGWRSFLKSGVSVKEAYLKTMRTFYIAAWEQQGSELTHRLKPRGERPSLRQFQYHGSHQDDGLEAWKIHLGTREYQLNHRPLDGLPNVGLRHIGAVAQADAATNDVHLVSVFDRTRIVGTCHHILIVDEFTGLIVGFSVAWNVDAQTAKLAMLSAASSKVDLCSRYGISITDAQWPRAVFAKLLVDRGEFNCEAVYEACRSLNCSLEMAQTGRGDAKGLVEAKHHALHAASSHQLPGTTRGRMRGRGEREPALEACMDVHEYTGELVRAIIHHNTQAPVPNQLTTEMLNDKVAPTRIAIWNWARNRGYVAYTNCEHERLITTLCPEIDAIVEADGIHLITRRPSPAKDEIIVFGLRYMGEIAKIRGWLETARRRGKLRISVFHNPYDLRRVWYLDPESGLQALDLVTNDPLLGSRATLTDLLQAQTHLSLVAQQQEEAATQSLSNMGMARETTVHNARSATEASHALSGSQSSKRERLKGRSENRTREIEQSGKQCVPPVLSLTPKPFETHDETASTGASGGEGLPQSSLPALERWLSDGEPR